MTRLQAMERTYDDRIQADFDEALNRWLEGAQAIINRYFAHEYPNQEPGKLTVGDGSHYIRVIKTDSGSRSAFAFIDRTNGDVLKSAGWKAPAKHARGNIFDESNGLQHMSAYGPAYLR